MKEKTYYLFAVIMFVLYGIFATFLENDQSILDEVLPFFFLVVGASLLNFTRKKIRVDERIKNISGRAAYATFNIVAITGVGAFIVMQGISERTGDLTLGLIGDVLSLFVGLMLCIYGLLYLYYAGEHGGI